MFLKNIRMYVYNFVIVLISIISILSFLEIGLIIKNHVIIDYYLEMWKYSKKLKIAVHEKKINHVHKKNSSAELQKVRININSLGMRGTEEDYSEWVSSKNKILFIGSSITLGWGVEEKMVMSNVLESLAKSNNLNWATLNGGVGNYNTERYISNFFENYVDLKPDIVFVQYFINDAEILDANKGNFLTRNFHLGVALWKYFSLMKSDIEDENIYEYYKKVYKKEKQKKIVKNNLSKFSKYCMKNQIRCIIMYIPDLNLIKFEHKLIFARDYVKEISGELDLEFLDLSYKFENQKNTELTNSEFNDRHPSSFAHQKMGKEIYNYLIN